MSPPRLRIVLCTRGGLHGALVLHRLLAAPRVDVRALVISTRLRGRHQGFRGAARDYLRHSGAAYAAYLWCSTSLAGWLLRFASEGPVASVALARGIPVLATRDVNDERGRGFVAGAAPQLLVSAFFNQRIGEDLVRLARHGGINIHPGRLPDFRGVDPVFFARLRGAAPAVSLHRLAPEFDAGDILATDAPADAAGSVFAATAGLYDRGAALLARDAEALAAASGIAQGPGGSYDSWPQRAEVLALARGGSRLVSAHDLWRLARRGPRDFIIESGG